MAIVRAKIHHKNVQKQSKERGYTAARAPSEALVVDYPNITWCEDDWGWAWFYMVLLATGFTRLTRPIFVEICGNAVASVIFSSPCQRVLPPAICIQSGRKWWQSQWQSAAALPRGKPTHLAERGKVCNKFLHFEGLCLLDLIPNWPYINWTKDITEARIATLWLSSHITEWILLNSVIMFEGFRGEICDYQIHKSQLPAVATVPRQRRKKRSQTLFRAFQNHQAWKIEASNLHAEWPKYDPSPKCFTTRPFTDAATRPDVNARSYMINRERIPYTTKLRISVKGWVCA